MVLNLRRQLPAVPGGAEEEDNVKYLLSQSQSTSVQNGFALAHNERHIFVLTTEMQRNF